MLTQTHFHEFFTKKDIKREPWEIVSEKIDAVVASMTAQEKMDLLYGWPDPEGMGKIANAGYLPGVPRLGVPEIRMYDGPAGVTSICETTGLPNPILLAATWDEQLAYDFGRVAGSENISVSGNHQLGTQLDTIRTPHFMRNKDMKGEDYFLSSRLGVAEVKGVQDQGVVGTLKHFAVANTMAMGEILNEVVDEQTLHETYLRQFEDAVIEADAGSVMDTYSFINGHYATDNNYLNNHVLRGMWGFKGSVMSDWGANHNMTLGKGMDMEMPRPAYNSSYRILRGIQDGSLNWDDINNGAKHVLGSLGVVGLLSFVQLDDDGRPLEEFGRNKPIRMAWTYEEDTKVGMLNKNAETALEIARKGIILAKNDGALPLTKDDYSNSTVALIGLGAVHAFCGEGQERSFGRLERMISLYEHITSMEKGNFVAEKAIDLVGNAIPSDCLFQDEACEKPGVIRTWGVSKEDTTLAPSFKFGPGGGGYEFNGISGELDEYGELVENLVGIALGTQTEVGPCGEHTIGEAVGVDASIDFVCGFINGKPVKNYKNTEGGKAVSDGERFTWKAFLKAPESGEYKLKLEAIGGHAGFLICIDSKWERVGSCTMREGAQWPWDSVIPTEEGMGINGKVLRLEKDKIYPIVVYGANLDPNKDLQLRAAWITPSMEKADYENALKAARSAKKVVLFLHDYDDHRGFMMGGTANHELPKAQLKLFDDIKKITEGTGAKLIVVYQCGPAYATKPWADSSDAVIITYLPGQEGAQALAEILLGKVNPSGKLAQTWPKRNEDTPVSDTPEHNLSREKGIVENGRKNVHFSEGIFYGYRWYDKMGIEPGFAFGHGLSYTTFKYSNLNIIKNGSSFEAEVTLINTGNMSGDEVVQLYLGPVEVPAHIQMAEKQLAGFIRMKELAPGKSKTVRIKIPYKSLCYWDPALSLQLREDGTKDKWQLAYGKRKVYIGASSRDIRLEGEVIIDIPKAENNLIPPLCL